MRDREDKIRRRLGRDLSPPEAERKPLPFATYEKLWFWGLNQKTWWEYLVFLQFLFTEAQKRIEPKGNFRVFMDGSYTDAEVSSIKDQALKCGLVGKVERAPQGGEIVITFSEFNSFSVLDKNPISVWKNLSAVIAGPNRSAPAASRDGAPTATVGGHLVTKTSGATLVAVVVIFVVYWLGIPPVVSGFLLIVIGGLALVSVLVVTRTRAEPPGLKRETAVVETSDMPPPPSPGATTGPKMYTVSEQRGSIDLEEVLPQSDNPNQQTSDLAGHILEILGDELVVRNYLLKYGHVRTNVPTHILLEEHIHHEVSEGTGKAGKEVLKQLLSLAQLQKMAEKVRVKEWQTSDTDQLATDILKAHGFKVFGPPSGIEDAIRSLRACRAQFRGERTKKALKSLGKDVGEESERILRDVLHLYCHLFWGEAYEKELRDWGILDSRWGKFHVLKKVALGQATHILKAVNDKAEKDSRLRKKLQLYFDRQRVFPGEVFMSSEEAIKSFKEVSAHRNYFAHVNDDFDRDSFEEVRRKLEEFINLVLQMFENFQLHHVYPPVVCCCRIEISEAHEQFCICLQESGEKLKIRTDERMVIGDSYFCWASADAIAIRPLLIPKERKVQP